MNIINVGYDSTNYYVLEEKFEGKNVRLLIDVGMPGTLGKLLANLKRKDIALSSIRYLLCTHYHPDHAAIAQEVKAQGVSLIIIDLQLSTVPMLNQWVKPTDPFHPITLHNTVQLTLHESRAFLKKLGFNGEIIHTPGHSDDSVSLVLDQGIAFTGDLHRPEVVMGLDHEKATRSWDHMRALHVTTVYPGHGPQQPIG